LDLKPPEAIAKVADVLNRMGAENRQFPRVIVAVEAHASTSNGKLQYGHKGKNTLEADINNVSRWEQCSYTNVNSHCYSKLLETYLGTQFIAKYLQPGGDQKARRPWQTCGLIMLSCYQALKYRSEDYFNLVKRFVIHSLAFNLSQLLFSAICLTGF